LLADKDREIERLKEERVGLQNRITNAELLILSANLLLKMFNAARVGEERYFYLKAEDGIVTGYEMDIAKAITGIMLPYI
jgi:hypothetical protein